MGDYPGVPLYKGEDICALKRVIDPRFSVVLRRDLWNNGDFRLLPSGAKLLYGMIASKMMSGNADGETGKTDGILFHTTRIKELLGCSLRSAQEYLNNLADCGLVERETAYGAYGKGMHNQLCLPSDKDTSGTAIIVIPISLFSNENFIRLPDGAKLMYGVTFANMANDMGFTDPMGNYCQFLPAEKFVTYCMLSRVTHERYMRMLDDTGLATKVRLNAKGKRGRNIDLVYMGRLV